MIESGSHVPGISGDDFGLPDHTALRWERPDEALRAYVSSYAVIDWDVDQEWDDVAWMLPDWARIGIGFARAPTQFTVRNRHYDPLPSAALLGVTSRTVPVSSGGGVTIAIDISPLGWSRLLSGSAETYCDRVTPLDIVMPRAVVHDLTLALAHSDRALDVKPILDAFLAPLLATPHRDDAAIRQLMALLADTETIDMSAAATASGIMPHTLRRLSKRYFGFPPKVLMARTRFIRALMPLIEAGAEADHAAIPPGYYDLRHFRRDAERFLGMTPRQYIAQVIPYMTAFWRARRMVIGAAVPMLDPFTVR